MEDLHPKAQRISILNTSKLEFLNASLHHLNATSKLGYYKIKYNLVP